MIDSVRFGGIAVFGALLAGCFSPNLGSGELRCSDGLCPEGYRCDEGVCLRGGGVSGGDPDAASATIDAAVEADAMEQSDVDAAPPDTRCYGEAPIPIVLGQTYQGDTENEGFDNANGCNAFGPEVYFALELDAADLPADVTFDALQTNYDLVLRVRQGICDDQVAEFICEDPNEGDIETRTISVPGTYFVLIDSHTNNQTGQFELTVTAN